MRSRLTIRIALPVLLAALLGGCGGEGPSGAARVNGSDSPSASASATSPAPQPAEPHTLVFSATGDAKLISVMYVVEEKTVTETSAALPWRKSFTVPSGERQEWRLDIKHRDGTCQVFVTVDGNVVTQGGGAGDGEGTLSMSGAFGG